MPRNTSLTVRVCKAGSAADRNTSSSKSARVSAHKAEARAARWKRAVLAVAVAITTTPATCARSQSGRTATARKYAPPLPLLPPLLLPPPPLCVARDRDTSDASAAAAEVQRRRRAPRAVARTGGSWRRLARLVAATATTARCGGAVVSELSGIAASAPKCCGKRVQEGGVLATSHAARHPGAGVRQGRQEPRRAGRCAARWPKKRAGVLTEWTDSATWQRARISVCALRLVQTEAARNY